MPNATKPTASKQAMFLETTAKLHLRLFNLVVSLDPIRWSVSKGGRGESGARRKRLDILDSIAKVASEIEFRAQVKKHGRPVNVADEVAKLLIDLDCTPDLARELAAHHTSGERPKTPAEQAADDRNDAIFAKAQAEHAKADTAAKPVKAAARDTRLYGVLCSAVINGRPVKWRKLFSAENINACIYKLLHTNCHKGLSVDHINSLEGVDSRSTADNVRTWDAEAEAMGYDFQAVALQQAAEQETTQAEPQAEPAPSGSPRPAAGRGAGGEGPSEQDTEPEPVPRPTRTFGVEYRVTRRSGQVINRFRFLQAYSLIHAINMFIEEHLWLYRQSGLSIIAVGDIEERRAGDVRKYMCARGFTEATGPEDDQ